MEKEYKERILKDIKKSGHPVSIEASNILISEGWRIKNSPRYLSERNKDYREIDIFANKSSSGMIDAMDCLVIECKKSESAPWVFFRQPHPNKDVYTLNIVEMTKGIKGVVYEWISKNRLFEKHYYYGREVSTYYLVPFKKQDKEEGREIDKAINQVLDALLFYLNQMTNFIDSKGYELKVPFFYYPIIIFDGDLFEAKITKKGVELEESNHVSLLVERESENPGFLFSMSEGKIPQFSKPIIIDVVRLDYLKEFLKNFG